MYFMILYFFKQDRDARGAWHPLLVLGLQSGCLLLRCLEQRCISRTIDVHAQKKASSSSSNNSSSRSSRVSANNLKKRLHCRQDVKWLQEQCLLQLSDSFLGPWYQS